MAGIQRRLQRIHQKSGDYDIPYCALYACTSASPRPSTRAVLLAGDCAHATTRSAAWHERRHPRCSQLAEKLAEVWFGRAEPDLLDRYTRQRRKAQIDYVQAMTIGTSASSRRRTGDPAQASRRAAAHLRGRHAAQEVSLSLLADRQF